MRYKKGSDTSGDGSTSLVRYNEDGTVFDSAAWRKKMRTAKNDRGNNGGSDAVATPAISRGGNPVGFYRGLYLLLVS